MAIGWCDTLVDADDYFANERPDADCWDGLDSASKTPLLMRSYNRLYYSKEFILPKYPEADSDDLEVLVKAQCEMAYYLCCHGEDEDRRKGIQAQAVVEAGVVKEKYKDTALYDTPIPQFVRDLLCQYLAGDEGTHFGAIDLERDEEESVNTKVHDF